MTSKHHTQKHQTTKNHTPKANIGGHGTAKTLKSSALGAAPGGAQPINGQTLNNHITADIHACEALLTLLEKERTALKERDLETLENIIHSKAAQLQHLEDSARTRSQWSQAFISHAQGDGATGTHKKDDEMWRQLLSQQAPELATSWQRLKKLMEKCRAENEVNGKVLSRNQKTFTRLMTILRGQTGSTNLYSASGSNQSHLPGQSIGQA